MRYIVLVITLVAAAIWSVADTDTFRDPGTIASHNRLVDAQSNQLEIENNYQARLYALDLEQRALALREREAAFASAQEWQRTLENWSLNVLDTLWGLALLGVGGLGALAIYRIAILPSLIAYWQIQAGTEREARIKRPARLPNRERPKTSLPGAAKD